MEGDRYRSLTPDFPLYGNVRHFLRVLEGVEYSLFRSMHQAIWGQSGNPQATVDWTDPDDWIPKRLAGAEQDLARRVWQDSGGELNPRYMRGSWYLAKTHGLIEERAGLLSTTPRGRLFLTEPEGQTVAEIDAYDGVLAILRFLGGRGASKRSEILPFYTSFCQAFTNYRSESVIKNSLYDRLVNLVGRGYVIRRGQGYEISDAGVAFLERYGDLGSDLSTGKQESELQRMARKLGKEARAQLASHLATMHPYKFEGLIGLLLQEMGYTDIEITSPSNDKGVDVVADFEVGISSVREVVQVKRHKGNIHRRVLDELRGSLHRFNAMRGTIITTGSFSKGTVDAAFEHGAAPITLIDGEKLLDLLVENEIGVKKTAVEYVEFDPSKLAQFDSEVANDDAALPPSALA